MLRFCNATFEHPFELFDFLGGWHPDDLNAVRVLSYGNPVAGGASAATGKDEGGEL
jgi:hypothetical protein